MRIQDQSQSLRSHEKCCLYLTCFNILQPEPQNQPPTTPSQKKILSCHYNRIIRTLHQYILLLYRDACSHENNNKYDLRTHTITTHYKQEQPFRAIVASPSFTFFSRRLCLRFEIEYGGVQAWSILGRRSRMVSLFYCHYHPSPVISYINSPTADAYLPFLIHNTMSSISSKTLLASLFAFEYSLPLSSHVD